MVVTSKKFVLKKKTTPTGATATTHEETQIENNQDQQVESKSILKKKVEKVDKVEKKKVIFKTEKNQTQLFNKTLKIADKPIVIKSNKSTANTTVESSPIEKEEEPIIITPTTTTTTKVSSKKGAAPKSKPATVVEEQPIIVEEPIKPTKKSSKKGAAKSKQVTVVEEQPMMVEGPMIVEESIITEEPPKKQLKNNNVDNKNNNDKKKKKEQVESDSDSSSSSDEEIITKKDKKKENLINGFIILPVSMENSSFKKYLYIKKETNKKWPQNKTLFVTNLPTHCSSLQDVQKLFKYDFIESVHFGQPIFNNSNNNNGFIDDNNNNNNGLEKIDETTKHVAHIVMKDQDSLNLFLKKSHSLSIQQPSLQLNGFDEMKNQYNSNIITDYDELQNKLDNIMLDYDRRVLETKKRSKQRQVPDEEGFITVGPSSAKVMTAEEVKALMEKKQKKNFYAFQHRQNKKDELDVLRQKFEEDKQRISKITAARKFKPY